MTSRGKLRNVSPTVVVPLLLHTATTVAALLGGWWVGRRMYRAVEVMVFDNDDALNAVLRRRAERNGGLSPAVAADVRALIADELDKAEVRRGEAAPEQGGDR